MTKEFVTAPADIAKLAQSIMGADQSALSGRATYLRSIVAHVQQTLSGRPVLRVTGRPKGTEIGAAVEAFEAANGIFYAAVLEAVPEGLTPQERQSRTSFARSSAATLRRAIKAGWNPLGEACTTVSKARLAAFTKDNSTPRAPGVKALEGRVMRYTHKVAELVDGLPPEERDRVLGMVLADLGGTSLEVPAIRNISVARRTALPRPVPH
jgi:hypothetical protein